MAAAAIVVVGIVVVKLAASISMVSWFWLANRDDTEHLATTSLIVSGIVGVIGLVVFVSGMFVW